MEQQPIAIYKESAKKQGATLRVQLHDRSVYLHSRIDPIQEAEQLANQLFSDSVASAFSALIFLGLGLGYHYRAIRRLVPPQTAILIIEKEEQVATFCRDEMTITDPILVNPTKEELETAIKELPSANIKMITHRGSHNAFSSYYDSLWQELQTFISHKEINIATLGKFEKIWLRNFFHNIPRIRKSPRQQHLSPLMACDNSLPAVLIGAGPSLGDQISWMKENHSYLFLAAVDTALKPMLDQGLQPDVVFTVDGQLINSLYLRPHSCPCPLIAEPTSHPLSLRHWQGPIFFFSSPFSYVRLYESIHGEFGELKHGGSVSTNAFDFLTRMRFPEIFLVGQDLAFSKDRAHAAGTYLDELMYNRENRQRPREQALLQQLRSLPPQYRLANQGNQVYTNDKLLYFQNWFNREIPLYQHGKVINLASEGLPLAGAQFSRLTELPPFSKVKTESVFYQTWIELTSPGYHPADHEEAKREFDLQMEELTLQVRFVLTKLQQGLELTTELLRLQRYQQAEKPLDSRISRLLAELDHLDKEIGSLEQTNHLLSPVMQQSIQRILSGSQDFLDEEARQNPLRKSILTSGKLYQGMHESLSYSLLCLSKGKLLRYE